MKFLLQFPTLGRPEKFINCLEKYIDFSSHMHHMHFNFNCDESDITMNNSVIINQIHSIISNYPHISYNVHFDKNTTKISAINDHIDNIDFDIVICISDDMIPVKQNWDDIIANKMQTHFEDTFGCLHFNDGLQGQRLITLSILGKKLYDYFGYIYHPDYKSLYCDDEFTNQVYSLNKVQYFDEVIIMHEHYSKPGSLNDGDYDFAAQKTLHFSHRDASVFQQRAALNFPKNRITND